MPARSKYGNRKVMYKGMRFDSILEYRRYIVLEDAQTKGLITNLERQVRYSLDVNGSHICDIILDFRYHRTNYGTITEDAKGIVTPDWRIKAKLFSALYHKDVRIVTKATLHELPG